MSVLALMIGLGFGPSSVFAETLRDALVDAYQYNPTLRTARAELRATDNSVSRALSGYRPTITASADGGYSNTNTKLNIKNAPPGLPARTFDTTSPSSYGVSIEQTIFDGFQTKNAVSAAEAQVEAGREDLRSREQQVLLDAVTAYMNVYRDQAILRLRDKSIQNVTEQVRGTGQRLRGGEVVQTEMSQAQARLAAANGELGIARANLSASVASYIRVIGHAPGTLAPYDLPPRSVFESADSAASEAQRGNPALLAAIFRERAQASEIARIKGELLPRVTLEGSYRKSNDDFVSLSKTATLGRTEDSRVVGKVAVPLYEAGEVSARIRQAQETRLARKGQIDEARDQARSAALTAFGQVEASKFQIEANRSRLGAARVVLDGVRRQERAGQLTVLEVLNAEQEALNAGVTLVASERDLVVAVNQLLQATGRLTAADIALPVEIYDPTRNYDEVRNKAFGWWTASVKNEESPSPVTMPRLFGASDGSDGSSETVISKR